MHDNRVHTVLKSVHEKATKKRKTLHFTKHYNYYNLYNVSYEWFRVERIVGHTFCVTPVSHYSFMLHINAHGKFSEINLLFFFILLELYVYMYCK